MAYDKIVAADDASYQLPPLVRGTIEANLRNPATGEGDAVQDVADARVAALAPAIADTQITTARQNGILSPNYVINGAFDIWQRGTSFSGNVYTADRWYTGNNPSAISRSTDVPSGFTFALDVTGSNHLLGHRIESVNANALSGKNVTVSFYAKSLSGTNGLTVAIGTPSATDNFAISNIEHTSSAITISSSWTRYSVTFNPLSSGVARGAFIYIYRNGSTPTDRTLITGVQLEEGSTATPFRRNANSIQGELAACQRYYWRAISGSAFQQFASGMAGGTTSAQAFLMNPVQMRAAPSSLEFSTIGLTDTISTFAVTNITLSFGGVYGSAITLTSSGLTAFRPYLVNANNSTSAFIGMSAEL